MKKDRTKHKTQERKKKRTKGANKERKKERGRRQNNGTKLRLAKTIWSLCGYAPPGILIQVLR